MGLINITYDDKTNGKPIIDRSKQSTAEDWNMVKEAINDIVSFLHIESGDIDLTNGLTSFTITFNEPFEDTTYRVLGGAITVYQEQTEDGETFINEIPIKNIQRFVDKVTFETLEPSNNYRVDYYITKRS